MKLTAVFSLLICLVSVGGHAQPGREARPQLGTPPGLPPAARPADPDSVVAVAPVDGLSREQLRAVRYRVGLKTGQVLGATQVGSRYPVFRPGYLLLDGTQQLALAEVHFYEDETGHYRRARPAGGLRWRETTLRRVQAGRLSVYEPRSSLSRRLASGAALVALGNPWAAAATVANPRLPGPVFFAKDEGAVYSLNHRHLRRAVADNPGALLLENRAHRYEVGKTAAVVAGTGLLTLGLLRAIAHGLAANRPGTGGQQLNRGLTYGILGSGVALLVLPLTLKDQPARSRQQAIELYNYSARR